MIPHLMYHIYHQRQETPLLQLCGDCAKPLLNNLFLTNSATSSSMSGSRDCTSRRRLRRTLTWVASNGLYDLYSLRELGDFYELSADRFWNTLDAVGLKDA